MKTGTRHEATGNNERSNVCGFALFAMLFALCASAQAQQPAKVPRIGFLVASNPAANVARIAAFQDGLRELGYVEGKNIIFDYRYAEGKLDRLPALAVELVGSNVDVIVTGGPADTRAAKKATRTIPIVMTFDNDPVGNGSSAVLRDLAGTLLDCRRWLRN
jgi:putative ABC transport system substrate-binding protein